MSWNMNIEIKKIVTWKTRCSTINVSSSENLKTKFFIEVRNLKCHIFIWWNKDSSLVITTYTAKLVVTVSFSPPTGIWVVFSINHLLVSAVFSLHSREKCWGKFWGYRWSRQFDFITIPFYYFMFLVIPFLSTRCISLVWNSAIIAP